MGRKVISFSLWGDLDVYNVGAVANAALAPKVYPGWICRFYVHKSSPVIDCLRTFRDVEVISMADRPGWANALWRFQAAADRKAELVIFRDCDSRLNRRERAAVDEWRASGLDAHVMRDVETHAGAFMLSGMFGVRGGSLPEIAELSSKWIRTNDTGRKYMDETFLDSVIWPLISRRVLVHGFPHKSGTDRPRPFPKVMPEVGEYVGQVIHPSNREILLLTERRTSEVGEHIGRVIHHFDNGISPLAENHISKWRLMAVFYRAFDWFMKKVLRLREMP